MNSPESPPAGGAAIAEVIGATAGATLLTVALLWIGWAHRTGRISFIRRAADKAGEITGAPGWAVLPGNIATVSLLVAVIGMYWDISLHIDDGRDAGPLANPAHYLILAGLFGIFSAGFLAVVLPDGRPSRAAVRISGDWYAPIGGVVLLACGAFALIGFPLDDMWHRLFGQDVTLWGPTHLMLIGGAGLSLLGYAALLVEGGSGKPQASGRLASAFQMLYRTRYAGVCGGLLVGLCTFQAEFDFGVPQFRLLFQPLLIAVAGGIALVAARVYTGRGGALVALAYYFAVRGMLAVLVGPVLGQSMPHFPLFAVEALVVEAVALRLVPRRRPLAFGAVCGALIGTVGFASEYVWSHLWMPIAWPSELIGEAIVVVPLTAIAAGVIGGFVGACLAAPRDREGVRVPRLAPAAVALVAIAAVVAYGLRSDHAEGLRGTVALTEAQAGPERTVNATVELVPAAAAEGADWIRGIAWQGGSLVNAEMEEIAPGTFRTTEPLPVYGNWKSQIRLHEGSSLVGLPVYLPKDPAIPAEGVPATSSFTREFVPEQQILQRERKEGVAGVLPAVAYGTVGAVVVVLIVLLGWALTRLAGGGAPPRGGRREHSTRRTPLPTAARGRA